MTSAWLLREMRQKGGGFAASLDADTDHEEGLTYVWTPDQLGKGIFYIDRELNERFTTVLT